jgi:catabolite regulation protein CreA
VNNVRLSKLGTSLYLQLQKLDFKSKPIVRLIDRLNTRWLRMSSKVSAGALQYARSTTPTAFSAATRTRPSTSSKEFTTTIQAAGSIPA